MDRHKLGQRIHDARRAANLTAEQLASQVGITSGTLRRYERGQIMPGFDTVSSVAQALGQPLAYFGEGDAAPAPPATNGSGPQRFDPLLMEGVTVGKDILGQVEAVRAMARSQGQLLRGLVTEVEQLVDLRDLAGEVERQSNALQEIATQLGELTQTRRSPGMAPTHDGSSRPTRGSSKSKSVTPAA